MYPKKIIRTKDNKEENIELNYIGRRLEKVEVDGKEYKYTYDDQGQRIKKEGNGKEEYYFYEEGRIKEVITKEYRLIYRYVGEEVKGVTYKNENKEISYFYEKNILGEIIGIVDEEGKRVVEYRSSSYGEVENIHDNSKIEISAKDHLRYKGYIYDEETRLYYLKTRYYDPEIGRFISPDSIDYQSPESINGLNLYAYAKNNPISFLYSNDSTTVDDSILNNVNFGSITKSKFNLGWIANGISAGSTIYDSYELISVLVNHTAYFSKNLHPFAADMTMLGVSMKKGVLAFNQFNWGISKVDVFGIVLNVGLDIFDSIQRGASSKGIMLGAALTAAKSVGLIYLDKVIIYGATAIGNCFGPGGAVVGFAVGVVIAFVVNIIFGGILDNLIDRIAK